MTTRITKVNGHTGENVTLRVEGSMRRADAELLEATYLELQAEHEGGIAIDLGGTNFLDRDSASVLCRLRRSGAQLTNLHYFVEQIIQAAEID
jgi:anti-anti-sigma regulatory factor